MKGVSVYGKKPCPVYLPEYFGHQLFYFQCYPWQLEFLLFSLQGLQKVTLIAQYLSSQHAVKFEYLVNQVEFFAEHL